MLDITDKDIGLKIREARRSKGISAKKLAELISINRNTLRRVEAGTSSISAIQLFKICKITDKSIYFFQYKDWNTKLSNVNLSIG